MAEYKHALIDDGQGNNIVFPPFVTQKEVDDIQQNFVVWPNDVYVVAYPKSGTTWMEQIVHLLTNNGEQGDKVLSEAVPWLEGAANRYGGLDKLLLNDDTRRKFHSHLPYRLMPGAATSKAKYIYVARNPKDNAISFYFHSCSKMDYEGSWDTFFELYMKGQVGYGSFFDHVLDWWTASQRQDNILFVTYGAMQKDLRFIVEKVAAFIEIAPDEFLLDNVVRKSRFKAMASNPQANLDWVPQREGVPRHMRKGVVGDWRNHFSPKQSAQMDLLCQERLAGSGLVFEFG
ncbi:MAG: sulfotransferase domain-containing protein [Chloroflexota bacterium]